MRILSLKGNENKPRTKCQICDGLGQLDGKDCEVCLGNGWVWIVE